MKRMGCINWDSAHPDTFFGDYTRRALSSHPERMPYYAEEQNGEYRFPVRNAVMYERELQYAVDAGIDFFAHCWYSRRAIQAPLYNPGTEDIGAHIHELSRARFWHMESPLRERIKLAAILGAYEINEEDYLELADVLSEPYYEKTSDGRPIIFLFEALEPTACLTFARMDAILQARGISPYWVGMVNTPPADAPNAEQTAVLARMDAISAYAQTTEHIQSYAAFAKATAETNAARAALQKPVLPLFSMGWNPSPRVKNPVPWITYGDIDYAPVATGEELIAAAESLRDWIRTTDIPLAPEHLLTFAWNELEEGGWICPTLRADGTVNDDRIRSFRTCRDLLCKA